MLGTSPLRAVDLPVVLGHLAPAEELEAQATPDPLIAVQLLAGALVFGKPPAVAHWTEDLKLARLQVPGVAPFAARVALHALRLVGLEELLGAIPYIAVRADVL